MLRTAWHKWFAWYPVCIYGDWVWFTTVYRRRTDPTRSVETFEYKYVSKPRH